MEMLDILSDFIGISYSLPKVDQAAIPDFAAGAMENWGLVTYRLIDRICDRNSDDILFTNI